MCLCLLIVIGIIDKGRGAFAAVESVPAPIFQVLGISSAASLQ